MIPKCPGCSTPFEDKLYPGCSYEWMCPCGRINATKTAGGIGGRLVCATHTTSRLEGVTISRPLNTNDDWWYCHDEDDVDRH